MIDIGVFRPPQMLFMYQRGLHDMQLPKGMGCNAATMQNSTKDGKALRPGSIETVCGLRGHSETRNHDQYCSGPTRIKVICDEWEQEFDIFTAEAW